MKNNIDENCEYVSKTLGISLEKAKEFIDKGFNLSFLRAGFNKKINENLESIENKFSKKMKKILDEEFKNQ